MWLIDAAIYEEMERSTDRGCAIVGHAHLEKLLPELLRRHLLPDDEEWNLLFGQGRKRGLVSDYGILIHFSYMTGLISKALLHDLIRLKNVRNLFGHRSDVTTFAHPEITKEIGNLVTLNVGARWETFTLPDQPIENRRRFELATAEAAMLMKSRNNTQVPITPVLDLPDWAEKAAREKE